MTAVPPATIGLGLAAVTTVTVLVLAVPAPALPVAGVGLVAVGLRLGTRAERPRRVVDVLGVPVLVGLFAVAVALGTLGRDWSGPATAQSHLDAWATAALAAGTSVVVNNLPAASLLAARLPPRPSALLIGLDVGPNLFVTGSLAWILWAAHGPGGGSPALADPGQRPRPALGPSGHGRRRRRPGPDGGPMRGPGDGPRQPEAQRRGGGAGAETGVRDSDRPPTATTTCPGPRRQQRPGKGAHVVDGQGVGRPPPHGRCLVLVRLGVAADDGGVEEGGDVGRLVSVGVGEPEYEDHRSRPGWARGPRPRRPPPRLRGTAASWGDSSGSMAPPMTAHWSVSTSRTSRIRPSSSRGRTPADGRTSSSCPTS